MKGALCYQGSAHHLTTVGRSAAGAALPPGGGQATLGAWAGGHGRLVRRLRLRRGAHVGQLER
jgi:hypothetical protein